MKFIADWSNILNPERREIVFENRNKKYGGYVLRCEYSKHAFFALVISTALITLILSAPLIVSFLSGRTSNAKPMLTDGVKLEEPPPVDKVSPPPPLVIPPPPVQQTIKFTPPKVVEEEVTDDAPPTQEEVKDVQVSTQNTEGIKDLSDLPPDAVAEPDNDKIFTVVEEMPSFPGGESKLSQYLSRIIYPGYARENSISGWVYLTFIVDKDGKIKDAKVLRGIGGGCDEEALRVLGTLPDWRPGRQNGRNVSVRTSLRVNFNLK